MELSISKKDIIEFEKLKIISELSPTKTKLELFEKKYNKTFDEFEKEIKTKEEKFSEWDDYIEWKAYFQSFQELTSKLADLSNVISIKIIEN